MSTPSIPEHAGPDADREKMNEYMAVIMPKDFAGAVNLMAHPLAGAAAFSALGLGLVSQAYGLWAGTVSGTVEAAQRLWMPVLEDLAPNVDDFVEKPKSPTVRAKAATEVLIDEARSVARETTEASQPPADDAGAAGVADARQSAVADAVAELMPEDFRQPKAIAKPEEPDDLKLISGVGPKLEQVLNGLGVWTYGQIASWSREEIAWVDDYLSFKGRIGRDNWIGQAAKLARDNKS
ncbi:NADH-ubiquinone dehydrogenase [Allomesorhizobium camelthorni]|uniref:NADH-ubiquinone dehydrogenase n=1 Tax=Allomesorhizobium camelthorni TaxID=475069 RepID=A0A6G4W8F0_9HYPH|nr:NADH-ubiquinone dehydrogenase [Mesorhizobium camelthorni]NGO50516.1 NADH-ubiquinone dehydrogenase [Mesorhizobium camelthorni]